MNVTHQTNKNGLMSYDTHSRLKQLEDRVAKLELALSYVLKHFGFNKQDN